MSAAVPTTLMLDYLFDTTAGNEYTFSILGETAGLVQADESITLEVPVSKMNKILTYGSSWLDAPGSTGDSADQPYPALVLRIQSEVGGDLDTLTSALVGNGSAAFPVDEKKDTVTGKDSTTCHTLLNRFQQINSFSFTDDLLAKIPVEAIAKFERSAVTAAQNIGSNVVKDNVAVPEAGETGLSQTALKAAIQTLFEQAVNAGMVTEEASPVDLSELAVEDKLAQIATVGAARRADMPLQANYGVKFVAGQTLGFYVKYALTKTRTYKLSDSYAQGSTAPGVITFGGVNFSLTAQSEQSEAVYVTYQIVLKAVEDV